MMVSKKYKFLAIFLVFPASMIARSKMIEFKGAYFLSTSNTFQNIYGNGSALYGPEFTMQLWDSSKWYGFVGLDYLKKSGESLGLGDSTTVKLIPFTFGLKYIVPTCHKNIDIYAGLGFDLENVRTKNMSDFVISKDSQWGLGGIAKVGALYYLPHNMVLDMFADYSFVRVGSDCSDTLLLVEPIKANVSGLIFGIGLGYVF